MFYFVIEIVQTLIILALALGRLPWEIRRSEEPKAKVASEEDVLAEEDGRASEPLQTDAPGQSRREKLGSFPTVRR